MIKKYIDCETVLEQITEIKNDFSPTVRPMFDVFKHMLSEAPAADVAPIVHGEWIETGYKPRFTKEVECSNCGKTQLGVTKHCPNCGARMEYSGKIKTGGNE